MILREPTDAYAADINILNDGPIVFAFDNMATTGNIDRRGSGWGVDYFVKRGINVISFMETQNWAWYRRPAFLTLLEMVLERVDPAAFPRRVSYGVSMGGYAAGAFSRRLGCDTALMFVPISTLNKTLAPFETRYRRPGMMDWDGPFHDAAAEVAGIARPVVVLDPLYADDRRHMQRICAAAPQTQVYRVPGAGHAVAGLLNGMKMLSPFIEQVVAGEALPDRMAFARGLRARRGQAHYYKTILAETNPHMNPRRAVPFTMGAITALAEADSNFLRSGIKYLQLTNNYPQALADRLFDLADMRWPGKFPRSRAEARKRREEAFRERALEEMRALREANAAMQALPDEASDPAGA